MASFPPVFWIMEKEVGLAVPTDWRAEVQTELKVNIILKRNPIFPFFQPLLQPFPFVDFFEHQWENYILICYPGWSSFVLNYENDFTIRHIGVMFDYHYSWIQFCSQNDNELRLLLMRDFGCALPH